MLQHRAPTATHRGRKPGRTPIICKDTTVPFGFRADTVIFEIKAVATPLSAHEERMSRISVALLSHFRANRPKDSLLRCAV